MKYLLILSLLVFNVEAASRKKAADVKKSKIRKEMNTISGRIRELGPYVASENEFTKKENTSIIQKDLTELFNHFKNLKAHPVVEAQGIALNQSVMSDQLEQTLNLFKNDKKSLARAKFNAALNLCVQCHTQTPGIVNKEQPKIFSDKDIEKMKLNAFEKAELYFITRDFDSAMRLYDRFLKDSKKTDDDEFVYRALERELVYYVKIKRDPILGKTHFEELLKGQNFNEKINQEVQDWIKTLGGKPLWEGFDAQKVSEADMEKFMKNFISDDEEGPVFTPTNSSEVADLTISTILLDYYNAHPETKLGAKILYWLAQIDKRIEDDLFFYMGDYYLLACMEKYPKDPTAKECYDSYIDELEIIYLSKEKKFPPQIDARIKRLQKLLDIKEEEE